MATPSVQMITNLYRNTLRTAKTFDSYSFRNYFVRRTHDVFRTMQAETNPDKVKNLYQEATAELAVMRRSAIVNQLYGGSRLVVETAESPIEHTQVLERSDS
ncbi:hypothetical protein L218DRAFT_930847 [Marasmius fiardii PR-910]|nr:hypothetical protein L218DRAFT_930847 [Marasmius fiardii PR-910]